MTLFRSALSKVNCTYGALTEPRVEGKGLLKRLFVHDIFAARFRDHFQLSEVPVMSKRKRSFFLMSLIPASLLVGVFAVVQAQNAPAGPQDASRRRQGHH